MICRLAVCLVLGVAPRPGAAVELALPQGARQLAERVSVADSYDLPVGAFADGKVPVRTYEGRIERLTYRLDAPGVTTLQILAPLREQLQSAGFSIVFQCEDTTCGGFDFRFKTEVVPAPDMYVDIRNYRFVAATGEDDAAVSLLVSRSRSAAYVQIVHVNRDAPSPPVVPEPEAPDVGTEAPPPPDLAETLLVRGHVVLRDLVFGTGSDALDPGKYASLEALSAFLADRPGVVIALVGHTDSIGALDQNIALSKRRAESVRARLLSAWGVAPERVQAEGMGYLAPVASNLTPEGREANRRVEAIVLSQ